MRPFVLVAKSGGPGWLVTSDGQRLIRFELGDPNDIDLPPKGYGPPVEVADADLNKIVVARDT